MVALLKVERNIGEVFMKKFSCVLFATALLAAGFFMGASGVNDLLIEQAHADSAGKKVPMYLITAEGQGRKIGAIVLKDSSQGLVVQPRIIGLTPGEHGFHVHENPDCSPKKKDGKMVAGLAAGSHYDPHSTSSHKGPHGGGHLGDLPKLVADELGAVVDAVTIAGVTVSDVSNRSLMIHAGGDNYSDSPNPLGGGGARVACGVIPK